MNRLVELIGNKPDCPGGCYGVLKTNCYPKEYYGGPVANYLNEWYTLDNSTSNWFKTKEEAARHARRKFENLTSISVSI